MWIDSRAVLICGALLVAGVAGAGPREPPVSQQAGESAAVVAVVDPAAWMKRLVGRYRFDGVIHHVEMIDFDQFDDARPNPDIPGSEGDVRGASLYANEWSEAIGGKGDCIAFSDGPGLQCVTSVVWPETWRVTARPSSAACRT